MSRNTFCEFNLEEATGDYYFLGSNWKRRVEHFGAKEAYDPEGVLVIDANLE